ncbi:hypothetical protein FDI24_gp210 [Acidovorax phage ACP17]|uniref:Uncharacterized protein n=1 Tax=Acidovorax phage ACP17 TaxID=2010329 RepID=A0A218M378_9CAUD|nr:hypothetical protein FDI24_gp210 [Acidovorax phage ACP17]ASD50491.1 hypothetical protein [Acidovorax phage ACP17]
MAVKTTGAEFKQFYNDEKVWEGDAWHEDVVLRVDGKYVDEGEDLNDLPDNASVVIEGGCMLDGPYKDKDVSMETVFKRWRKQLTAQTVVVEVDNAYLEAVVAAIKAAGGKIIK